MVKELSMVSSTVLMSTLRISRERCSRAAIIFTACPGMGGDTVFKRTFEPENLTSTSAIADSELAKSSLALMSLLILMEEADAAEEVEEEEGVVGMVGGR